MSITDELRKWARGFENVWFKPASKEIVVTTGTSMPVDHVNVCLFIEGMLDRIDAEHDELLKNAYEDIASDEFLEGHGWVKLPVDADGEPIRVGDEMEPISVKYDRFGVVTLCLDTRDGRWSLLTDLDGEWSHDELCQLRHYHAPKVEDVLREFADRYLDYEGIPSAGRRGVGEALMDEYAAKLRLAGEDE